MFHLPISSNTQAQDEIKSVSQKPSKSLNITNSWRSINSWNPVKSWKVVQKFFRFGHLGQILSRHNIIDEGLELGRALSAK